MFATELANTVHRTWDSEDRYDGEYKVSVDAVVPTCIVGVVFHKTFFVSTWIIVA